MSRFALRARRNPWPRDSGRRVRMGWCRGLRDCSWMAVRL